MKGLREFYEKYKTEDDCIKDLVEKRRGGAPVCPYCQHNKCCFITTRKVFKCAGCRKQFSPRHGTIYQDSRLPLETWFLAVFLLTSLKRGISSVQLAKYLGVTQKTAWFIEHRIRHVCSVKESQTKLSNVVEADETYVGGKFRGKRGRGSQNKIPVIGMVERGGKVICKRSDKVTAKAIIPYIQEIVEPGSHMMTDEYKSYNSLKSIGYEHEVIEHGIKVYVRGSVHTNTMEGFRSHLKRGIKGTYFLVSRKHIDKYCVEYTYKYNTKHMDDYTRFSDRLGYSDCKKISYLSLTATDEEAQQKRTGYSETYNG